MNKIDMHFHSTLSDWNYTNEQIIEEAIEKKLDFIVATEHDIINTEIVKLAKNNWINSLQWVEISTYDDIILNKSLHLTAYANNFNWKIHNILDRNIEWKIDKVKAQIETLKSNLFAIDYDFFIEYYKKRWFDINNLNSYHISEFILLSDENKKLIKELTLEELSIWDFIVRCLKKDWDLRHIWWRELKKYEPTVSELWELAKTDWFFLSLAHPNITFKNDIELFKYFINEYKEILNWIEISSIASKDWVETILNTAKKYKLIITYWSDDHFVRDSLDEYHWFFWDKNPYVSDSNIIENFKNFLLVINLIDNLKINKSTI